MGGKKQDGNFNDAPGLKIVKEGEVITENQTQSTFLISWGTRDRNEAAITRKLLVHGLGSVFFDHIEATAIVKHSRGADVLKIRQAIEESGAEIVEQRNDLRLWSLLLRLRSLILRSRTP